LRFLRPPHGVADVALLVGMSVLAIRAGEVHLSGRHERVFPDLVAAGLAINGPTCAAQVAAF
jgi:hypothetical protein